MQQSLVEVNGTEVCAGCVRAGVLVIRHASYLAGLTVTAFAMVSGMKSAAAQEVAVTPYRPTVSTPAALSAPGWLEGEAGLQSLGDATPSRRDSVPYTLKFAMSDDWGVRLGGELLVNDPSVDSGGDTGIGDTSVILKRRFVLNERSAFGLEAGATVATAASGLHSGSGKTDYGVTLIYSTDFGSALHADVNLGLSRLGLIGAGESRHEALWALALSDAVGPRWGIVGELSGNHQVGTDSRGQILFAGTYSPSKRVTWDFGTARGITAATPAWTVFAGATFLLYRLF
jgi:hypothetical protein